MVHEELDQARRRRGRCTDAARHRDAGRDEAGHGRPGEAAGRGAAVGIRRRLLPEQGHDRQG